MFIFTFFSFFLKAGSYSFSFSSIYECNQNCACSRVTCYNRVVQNGIQLRLQVFLTENRGWGLRCVDDIPKGTFVCTYAGQVLNEQTANKEGSFFFF